MVLYVLHRCHAYHKLYATIEYFLADILDAMPIVDAINTALFDEEMLVALIRMDGDDRFKVFDMIVDLIFEYQATGLLPTMDYSAQYRVHAAIEHYHSDVLDRTMPPL